MIIKTENVPLTHITTKMKSITKIILLAKNLVKELIKNEQGVII